MPVNHRAWRHGRWLPNRPLHRALYAGAALVIAGAAWVTYDGIGTLVETNAWVKHTHEVTYALEEIMRNLASAEAHHRGYLLNGDAGFVARLERARTRTWSAVERAEHLTRDNPAQQERFPRLRSALSARFEDMQMAMDEARAGAMPVVPPVRGEQAAGAIGGEIVAMKAVEGRLLAQRLKNAEQARISADLSAGTTGLLGFALLLALGYATERDRRRMQAEIAERRRAEHQVRELAAGLEERVLERTRKLTEANIELDAFSYTIAHDLRAPLRSIHGLGAALQEDCGAVLSPVAVDYLARMQDAATRMDGLISDLLAYARLGREEVTLGPVEIEACVKQVLREIAVEIDVRDAAVDVRTPLGRVRGHRVTVQQVLANLVINGLKFVRQGVRPAIRLYAEERGRCLRVWVEDNGIGVDERHAERIFRLFERLHGQEAYPGTGVGLAIVKKGVEWMGGRVGLEPGAAGTRFWFELEKL